MGSALNSRVLPSVCRIQSAFDGVTSHSQYHLSVGFWWHIRDQEEQDKAKPKSKGTENKFCFPETICEP